MGYGPEGKDKFPFGKQNRKDVLDDNAKEVAGDLEWEKRRGRKEGWQHNNSPLRYHWNILRWMPYQETFRGVLPRGESSVRRYIEGALTDKKGVAVGIDLGGPGSSVFADFTEGFFKKSAGVTLVDHRKPRLIERDEKKHHIVIPGNIFDPQTYNTVRERLGEDKIDLIFERLLGAEDLIPNEPYAISRIVQEWWKLLDEGGIVFMQTNKEMDSLASKWVNMLEADFSKVIQAQHNPYSDIEPWLGAIRLRRLRGAPNELPMLDPRTVRDVSLGKE
jgi:hypothetical protein